MRGITIIALAAFSGLAYAQLIDLDYVNALPDPTYTIALDQKSQVVPYNQATAIASVVAEALQTPVPDPGEDDVEKRDIFKKRVPDCASTGANSNIYNAVLNPAESFVNDAKLQRQALDAQTPPNYTRVYQNLKKAAQANGYMGYTIMPDYNVRWCAEKCSRTLGCQSFNTYFERSPSKAPAADCPNPDGAANPFCVLWGGPVSEQNALNEGQWRQQFHVVITASNGYVLTSSLNPLSSKAINAPLDCNNNDSYMGMRLLTDNAPFDPLRCAAICEATSQYNIDHPQDSNTAPRLCKFYNTYILNKNYISQGQVCSMYTQFWNPDRYAVNDGQYDGQGNRYTISSSVFFHNATDITAPICPVDITSLRGNTEAGAFCTSYNHYAPPPATTVTVITATTTAESCRPTQNAKRDEDLGEVVEAVVAVFPSKVDDPEITGTVPALVTIPAESLSVAGVYASATSAAIAELGGDVTASSDPSTTSPPSVADNTGTPTPAVITGPPPTGAVEKRAVTTPSIFIGRDPHDISSACSRIIITTTPTVTVQAQATQTLYRDCAQIDNTCQNNSPARLVAGSFTRSTSSLDDTYFTINIPFQICIYDTCSTKVQMSTNGIITVGDYGVNKYTNDGIPASVFSPNAVLFAFWDDLYISEGQKNYMDYSLCGSVGHRSVKFDWLMNHFDTRASQPRTYSFSATFYEDASSRVDLKYLNTYDKGLSATVGMQGPYKGQQTNYQYSYNQGKITNGLSLRFDPSARTFATIMR